MTTQVSPNYSALTLSPIRHVLVVLVAATRAVVTEVMVVVTKPGSSEIKGQSDTSFQGPLYTMPS